MSQESPTPEELSEIEQFQHGAYGAEPPEWCFNKAHAVIPVEAIEDRVGWYEFVKPSAGATTHIAYVGEGGSVYLPEGPGVVTEQDFYLAAASNRFWRLLREEAVG